MPDWGRRSFQLSMTDWGRRSLFDDEPELRRWQVQSCQLSDLDFYLDGGWEPFAVTPTHGAGVVYHLRRLRP